VLYVDFKLDESYTPSKISIRAGDGFHNLKVTLFAARNRLFRGLWWIAEFTRVLCLIFNIPVLCPARAHIYL
jgi:hypothetical protein